MADSDAQLLDKLKSQLVAMRSPSKVGMESSRKTPRHGVFDQCTTIDVGGTLYTASKAVLTSVPDTYFTLIYSGVVDPVITVDGHMFIDRDGKAFRWVLAYLRSVFYHEKTILLPDQRAELLALKSEAHFYQLNDLEAEAAHALQSLSAVSVAAAPLASAGEQVSGTTALKAASNQLEFESVYVTISNRYGPDFDPQACTLAMDNVNAKTDALQAKGFRVKAMNTGVAQDRKSKDYVMYYHVVLVRDTGVSIVDAPASKSMMRAARSQRSRHSNPVDFEESHSSAVTAAARHALADPLRGKQPFVQVGVRRHSRAPDPRNHVPGSAAGPGSPIASRRSMSPAKYERNLEFERRDAAHMHQQEHRAMQHARSLHDGGRRTNSLDRERTRGGGAVPGSLSSAHQVGEYVYGDGDFPPTIMTAPTPAPKPLERCREATKSLGDQVNSLRSTSTTIDTMAFDGASASLALESHHAQVVESIKPYTQTARINPILGITDIQEEQRIIDINSSQNLDGTKRPSFRGDARQHSEISEASPRTSRPNGVYHQSFVNGDLAAKPSELQPNTAAAQAQAPRDQAASLPSGESQTSDAHGSIHHEDSGEGDPELRDRARTFAGKISRAMFTKRER